MASEIFEVTRRSIIDNLSIGSARWSGRMSDEDFLDRIYDLTKLPSQDNRFSNAYGDIFQHRSRNNDWDDDWVFTDARFNLLHGDDAQFLRFLSETLHPIVRSDAAEARALAETYNSDLRRDGWEIRETNQISGRPIFAPQKIGSRVTLFSEPTGWQKVDRQSQEVRRGLETAENEENFQAVGLMCREVLISVAQEIYDPELHLAAGAAHPSKTDAGRMLDAYFAVELPGAANEEARAHAKAALRLALALQHKRTADFRTAALCAEGTLAVVNVLAVLAGRRGGLR